MLADAIAVTLSCYLFCSHAVAVETAVDSATISAAACRYLSSYAAAAAAVVSNQLMQRERNLPLDRAIAKAIALFYAGGFFADTNASELNRNAFEFMPKSDFMRRKKNRFKIILLGILISYFIG